MPTSAWYVTTQSVRTNAEHDQAESLGNRSFINQVKYSPKYQSVAIVGYERCQCAGSGLTLVPESPGAGKLG